MQVEMNTTHFVQAIQMGIINITIIPSLQNSLKDKNADNECMYKIAHTDHLALNNKPSQASGEIRRTNP